MHNEIYWILTLSVKPGLFQEFRKLVAEIVADTTNEPDALAYEYSVSADQSVVHVFERYRDAAAVVKHMDQTFALHADLFLSLATPTALVVYGAADERVRAKLDALRPAYMTVFNGFSRWQ